MSLKEYQEKRQFIKIPKPKAASKDTAHKEPVFVIQKHDATHLHFDFES